MVHSSLCGYYLSVFMCVFFRGCWFSGPVDGKVFTNALHSTHITLSIIFKSNISMKLEANL